MKREPNYALSAPLAKIGLFGALLCTMSPSSACLQDRDTLAQEAAANAESGTGLPHVVRVITGRFEQNPPRYYQMRLARVTREIAASPDHLELYDDAGVACDRLHRSKEAIAWMEKKRVQLMYSPIKPAAKREQWYRYFANIGTFHAHHWLRSGANRKEMSELKWGREMIRRAIEIKPNAHFGREKYQLKFMDWVLHPPKGLSDNGDIPDFLGLSMSHTERTADHSSRYEDAVTGLSGLVVLGDAWQSFDVFNALRQVLYAQGDSALAELASYRCEDIINTGGKSLSPAWGKWEGLDDMSHFHPINQGQLVKKYRELRDDAKAYQKARVAYMNAKFDQGLHPDTDPTFWNDWQEPPLPSLAMPGDPKPPLLSDDQITVLVVLGGFVAMGIGVAFLRRKAARRLAAA